MRDQIKIFGFQWHDLKGKSKQLLRKFTYSWLVQQLICFIILFYMRLVYFTCKKRFINQELLIDCVKNKTPVLLSFWHNRLMMIPFITDKPKKLYPNYNFMTLASRHGDGKFVGKVMENYGLISIYGSSKDGRKLGRGIEISSLKQIIKGLKEGLSLGISPDGPRGPNQKINGEIVNIARITNAKILPVSYSTTHFKRLKSWDRFFIPLPFGTLCFYFDDKVINVDKKTRDKDIEHIKSHLEERMNVVQEKSEDICKKKK